MDEISILSDPSITGDLPVEVLTVALLTKDKLGAVGKLSYGDARLRARLAELLLRFDSRDRLLLNIGAEVASLAHMLL